MAAGKAVLIKKEFEQLLVEANDIRKKEMGRYLHEKGEKKIPKDMRFNDRNDFSISYQKWYSKSYYLVKNISPERLPEFHACYYPDSKRKVFLITNYTIKDYITGLSKPDPLTREPEFNILNMFLTLFNEQIGIIHGLEETFDSILSNIRGVLQSELFDTELQAARELLKHGYHRAAGVIAGVALESHLAAVCEKHSCKLKKKNPSISDYNEALKDNGITDVPAWRRIQALYDIRTICAHKKKREPNAEEVGEMIDGVERTTKTVF